MQGHDLLIVQWNAERDGVSGAYWRILCVTRGPQSAYRQGYRYLAPVTPAAEVAALRERVKELEEALTHIANHPTADTEYQDYGPDRKPRVWPTVREEAIAALEKKP